MVSSEVSCHMHNWIITVAYSDSVLLGISEEKKNISARQFYETASPQYQDIRTDADNISNRKMSKL